MNRDEIIRMAREVGIDPESDTLCNYDGWVDTLVDFAALVAAAERKVIMDSLQKQADLTTDALDRQWALEMIAAVAARSSK